MATHQSTDSQQDAQVLAAVTAAIKSVQEDILDMARLKLRSMMAV